VTAAPTTAPGTRAHPIVEYFRGFKVLRETRREYWGLQAVNVLESAAYDCTYGIAVVFLSADFHFTDVQAGYVASAFTLGITACLFITGFITDWLGIRKSIYVSMGAQVVLRGIMMFAALDQTLPFRGAIAAAAFILNAPMIAMGMTMYQAANRRFTTRRSRGAGFNVWYLAMNFGYFWGSLSIDIVRKWLGLPNAYILVVSMVTLAACVLVARFAITSEEQLRAPDEEPEPDAAPGRAQRPWDTIKRVLSESVFWRFVLLCTLLLGVRACFIYTKLLFPKYWLRVIGPDAAIGLLQSINPALVALGLVVLIPLLSRFRVYDMLTYGALVSAASLFVLAIPAHGNAAYVTTTLCLLVLTVGEVIWSPRLTEYTAAIAPKGQEGTYYGLSMVPWFAAKVTVGALSGHMLNRWVPEGEPLLRDRLAAGTVPFSDSPSAMWLILGTVALAGVLLALTLRRWFTQDAREPARAAA
jgi:POT family proton-dependent oligopeptide transporter